MGITKLICGKFGSVDDNKFDAYEGNPRCLFVPLEIGLVGYATGYHKWYSCLRHKHSPKK